MLLVNQKQTKNSLFQTYTFLIVCRFFERCWGKMYAVKFKKRYTEVLRNMAAEIGFVVKKHTRPYEKTGRTFNYRVAVFARSTLIVSNRLVGLLASSQSQPSSYVSKPVHFGHVGCKNAKRFSVEADGRGKSER